MNGKRALQQAIGLAIVVLLFVGCGGAQAVPTATSLPPTPTPAPPTPTPVLEGLVDVGGYKLNIRCEGEGSPTVIFDSGLGMSRVEWYVIQSEIEELTRACCYDRVGLGKSDPYPKELYTTQDMVDDLHKLLENAHIPGPYVLVAHSMAGFNARLYASQYPQDVVGMVLVDVSHPDTEADLLALLPPESPDESSQLKGLRRWLVEGIYDSFLEGPEHVDWETSVAQVRATGSLGDIPLVVFMQDPQEWEPNLPPELEESGFGQAEIQRQKELAALSSNSTFIIVEDTGHGIHDDQPEVVLDAIRSVVTQARGE